MSKAERVRPANKSNRNVNKHAFTIVKNYFKYVTKQEMYFDFLVPLLLASIIIIPLTIIEHSNGLLFELIREFNTIALTIISILAGFNTSCLAIIVSTNKESLGKLFKIKQSKDNILQQVVTFFGYAVLTQLLILVFGLMMVLLTKTSIFFISNGYLDKTLLSIFSAIWISGVFYCLFITIRNVSLLYNYILYIGKDSNKLNDS